MNRIPTPLLCLVLLILTAAGPIALAQAPAKPSSFTPVLHSVSYAGVWRGQAQLTTDDFLVKAKELGFNHVELMAKRPHVSPLDYDDAARKKLKARAARIGPEDCLPGRLSGLYGLGG